MKTYKIELNDLPKISLNKFYAGIHWTKRKKMVDQFKWFVKDQYKAVFSKDGEYDVDYLFEFKKNALDAMNCVGMAKCIEDTIFEDDKWDIVNKVSMRSIKSTRNRVTIIVKQKI